MKKRLSIISTFIFMILFSSCSKADSKAKEVPNPISENTNNTIQEDYTEKTSNSLIYEVSSFELDRTINVSYPDNTFTMNVSSLWGPAPQMNYGKEIIKGLFFRIDKKDSSEYSDNNQFVDDFIKQNSNWKLYKNENGVKFAFMHEEANNSIEKERSIFKLYNSGSICTIYISTKSCDGLSLLSQKSIDNILNTVNIIENETITTQKASIDNTVKKSLSFSGNGDSVTETFIANDCNRVSAEYTGDSIFTVVLYDSEGNFENYIFSNIGSYSGQKVFKFENDKMYMLEVTARNGDWKINIE